MALDIIAALAAGKPRSSKRRPSIPPIDGLIVSEVGLSFETLDPRRQSQEVLPPWTSCEVYISMLRLSFLRPIVPKRHPPPFKQLTAANDLYLYGYRRFHPSIHDGKQGSGFNQTHTSSAEC